MIEPADYVFVQVTDLNDELCELLLGEGELRLSRFGEKYSRAQRKRVLVKRKVPKTYGYVRRLLRDMVELRPRVTLGSVTGLAEDDPRIGHGYVNPTVPLSEDEREALLAAHRRHSRFQRLE